MKVTSAKQPQSSCPFKTARQKIFGLGYGLLIFVDQKLTADFQMTQGILQILVQDGNKEDLIAFFQDKNLPVDEIEANNIADSILDTPTLQGYLTISNALQWRLQYGRVISKAGEVEGIHKIR